MRYSRDLTPSITGGGSTVRCNRLFGGPSLSPDTGDETLRPPHVRHVGRAELLQHHSLFGAEAKGAEKHHGEAVGRARNPVGYHERLADGIDK